MYEDQNLLRDVKVNGYRLRVVDDGTRYGTGQHRVRYQFFKPRARKPLFEGECGIAPSDAIDSDKALISILGWLTLKPGDTDSDFFAEYTVEQLDWCTSSDAEGISLIGYDVEASNEESFYRIHNGTAYAGKGRKRVFTNF